MNCTIENNNCFLPLIQELQKEAPNFTTFILKQKPHVKSSVLCSDIVALLIRILRLQLNDIIDEDCKQKLDMIPTLPLSEGTEGMLSTLSTFIQNKQKKANTGTSSTVTATPFTELFASPFSNHSNHSNTTTSTLTTPSRQAKRKRPSSPTPLKQ
jgi:hypothetical protein